MPHVQATLEPLIEAHGDGRRRATLHARGKEVGYMQARSHDLARHRRMPDPRAGAAASARRR